MTPFVRVAFASLSFSVLGLFLVGCSGGSNGGGNGNGSPTPTATTTATPTATTTATPTATPVNTGAAITSSQIVFVSNRGLAAGKTELFKSSLSGTNITKVSSLGLTINSPSISPDGRRIVFAYNTSPVLDSKSRIGIINSDGTGFRSLTDGTSIDYLPVFAGNSQFIYWASSRGAATGVHVWRMSAAAGNTGQNQVQVVSESSSYPSTDATGNLLAYVTNAFIANSRISIRNLTTNTTQRLGPPSDASGLSQVLQPTLSPDGTRLAFITSTFTKSTGNIYKFSIYTVASNAAVTTSLAATNFNFGGAWSRNSQTFFFRASTLGTGTSQIYASDAPFTSTRAITSGPNTDTAPALVTGF